MRYINMLFYTATILAVFKHTDVKSKAGKTRKSFNMGVADTTKELGKKVFYASCQACHKDSAGMIAPGFSVLSTMTPRAILASLNNGKMRQQATNLSDEERRAV